MIWSGVHLVPAFGRLALLLLFVGSAVQGDGQPSASGGAGHALQFSDHAIVLKHFKGFASDAFTFEAWIQAPSGCNRGTVMSYAKNRERGDNRASFNHFVIPNHLDIVGCHDFETLVSGDPGRDTCESAFGQTVWSHPTANFVDSSLAWHHLAVTWTAKNGTTKVYKDGLLVKEADTGQTNPLESNGALMLGNEQDCYGGCTNFRQAFYGMMDEVRLWKTERSQEEVLTHMRRATGLENHRDLLAYWKFDDPDKDGGIHKDHLVAKDSSGNGNDLPLVVPPLQQNVYITQAGQSIMTSSLVFENNYALNPDVVGMPTKDITVEFWARTPAYNKSSRPADKKFEDLLNYATHLPGAQDHAETVFIDDAVRIQKYYEELRGTGRIGDLAVNTSGSVVVRINGNREGNGNTHMILLYFSVDWVDDGWHHIAATWHWEDGETLLYFDGRRINPYFKRDGYTASLQDPREGGVDSHIAAQTTRFHTGSLVLGQNQECYGGCFSTETAYNGELANVRMWNTTRGQESIQQQMFTLEPASTDGLAVAYHFAQENLRPAGVSAGESGKVEARAVFGNPGNSLILWGNAPKWQYSTAPLMTLLGDPVTPPTAGSGGLALQLNDQQVLMHTNFSNFPSTAITVEFWMWSIDMCNEGTAFSYATEGADNAFLLYDYLEWSVAVMQDEGQLEDRLAGSPANDGTWHHIALTWQSSDGVAKLYDNGRKIWSVVRSQGKSIPSGGTLVIGREQDCLGGCFESNREAAGPISRFAWHRQDFFGLIDEMRIWKTVRTQEEIKQGMSTAMHRSGTGGSDFNQSQSAFADDKDLVAYWAFEDGPGYTIKDISGQGHDLKAVAQTQWQVVRWLAECGNGVIEGYEECDVGSTTGGKGCSKDCKVEEGYDCTMTSPSVCKTLAPGQNPHRRGRPGEPDDGPESGSGRTEANLHPAWARAGKTIAAIIGCTAGFATAWYLGITRGYLSSFAMWADGLRSKIAVQARTSQGPDGPEDHNDVSMARDFLDAANPRHDRGPYHPLPRDQPGMPI